VAGLYLPACRFVALAMHGAHSSTVLCSGCNDYCACAITAQTSGLEASEAVKLLASQARRIGSLLVFERLESPSTAAW
jgi:hypothetical protein